MAPYKLSVLGALCSSVISIHAVCCPLNSQDPFAKEAVMSSGPYKGQCIDTNVYRAAQRLTTEERSLVLSKRRTHVLKNQWNRHQ